MSKKTSSAPRPRPTPEKIPSRPPIQHQTVDHPQPEHTKGGKVKWG